LLLVLPKLWRPGGPANKAHPFPEYSKEKWDDQPLRVVAYEGDFQEVKCPREWQTFLDGCINCLTDRAAKDLVQDKDDPRRADDADLPPSFRHLLVRGSGRGTTGDARYSHHQDLDTFAKALDALVALAMRANAWKHGPVESSPRDNGLGALFRDAEEDTGDPLRVMAAQFFVTEVEARARDVRQGYVETTEVLPLIRGRITARGMTTLAYSGIPLAECTYDDFTPGVMLFRVIVTALDRVASGAVFPALIAEAMRLLCGRALALRHALGHIPSLPSATAAFEARRCRLGPLLRGWQPALDVARLLLREDPIELSPAHDTPSAHTWVIETPKVWEGILAALAVKSGNNPDAQSEILGPWSAGKSTNVDLRIDVGSQVYLIDAKYKVPGGDKDLSPSIADLYQIFAYTHLDKAAPNVHAALVYPMCREFEQPEPKVRRRQPLMDVKLRIGQVAFPTPEQTKSDENWDAYITTAGGQFRTVVFG